MPRCLWDKRRPACQPEWTLTLEFAGSPGTGVTVRWEREEGTRTKSPAHQANTCPLRLRQCRSQISLPGAFARVKRQCSFSQCRVYTDTKNFEALTPMSPASFSGHLESMPLCLLRVGSPQKEGYPRHTCTRSFGRCRRKGCPGLIQNLAACFAGTQWAVAWPWGSYTLPVPQFAHLCVGTVRTPHGAAVRWNELLCVNLCGTFSM